MPPPAPSLTPPTHTLLSCPPHPPDPPPALPCPMEVRTYPPSISLSPHMLAVRLAHHYLQASETPAPSKMPKVRIDRARARHTSPNVFHSFSWHAAALDVACVAGKHSDVASIFQSGHPHRPQVHVATHAHAVVGGYVCRRGHYRSGMSRSDVTLLVFARMVLWLSGWWLSRVTQ
jgi:hypothetical protein